MGDENKMPAKIAGALVKAARTASAVEKKGTVKTGSYSYRFAGADALMSEAREAMAESGLAVVLTRWWVEQADARVLFAEFVLCHEEGDTHAIGPYQMPVLERAGMGVDKSDASALTYLTGYVMRGLLNLPRVEEGSQVDERDDSQHKPAAPKLSPLEAITLRLDGLANAAALDSWCMEYGRKATKAVGLDALRTPLLAAADRLGVDHGTALEWVSR